MDPITIGLCIKGGIVVGKLGKELLTASKVPSMEPSVRNAYYALHDPARGDSSQLLGSDDSDTLTALWEAISSALS